MHYSTIDSDLTLKILHQLKEPCSLSDLAAELSGHPAQDVRKEVERLEKNWLIMRQEAAQAAKGTEIQLDFFSRDPRVLRSLEQQFSRLTVGVIDFVGAHAELNEKLRPLGFTNLNVARLSKVGELAADFIAANEFFIVLAEPHHAFLCSQINQTLVTTKKRWFLIRLDAYGGTIGPTFGLAGGPCFDCIIDFSKRQYGREFGERDYFDFIEAESLHSDRPISPLARMALGFASVEIAKLHSRLVRPRSQDGFYVCDFFNFRMQFSRLAPSPTCPVCSAHVREVQT